IITTLAGNGSAGFSGDGGNALLAQLNNPTGIFVDNRDDVFVGDTNNNRVREILGHPEDLFLLGLDNQVYTQLLDGRGDSATGYFLVAPGQVRAIRSGHDAGGTAELFV